jgi:hypothetical protein
LDAPCKFYDFTTPHEFEFNFIIPRRRVINGLFEANKRLYHLAGEDEARPNAKI